MSRESVITVKVGSWCTVLSLCLWWTLQLTKCLTDWLTDWLSQSYIPDCVAISWLADCLLAGSAWLTDGLMDWRTDGLMITDWLSQSYIPDCAAISWLADCLLAGSAWLTDGLMDWRTDGPMDGLMITDWLSQSYIPDCVAVSLLLSGWMGTQLVNRLRLAYHLTDWLTWLTWLTGS